MVYTKFSLKELRARKNMTQQELAERAGISDTTLRAYENDVSKLRNASYDRIEHLANSLDVSVDQIFLGDTSVKPKKSA